jgi:hypothetical protein
MSYRALVQTTNTQCNFVQLKKDMLWCDVNKRRQTALLAENLPHVQPLYTNYDLSDGVQFLDLSAAMVSKWVQPRTAWHLRLCDPNDHHTSAYRWTALTIS